MLVLRLALLLIFAYAEDDFEIEYIPPPQEERPMTFMSLLFTGLIAAVIVAFMKTLSELKLNTELLGKSGFFPATMFMGMLTSVILLYIHFWVCGNLVDTVKVLTILVFPFLFAARIGLAAVARARAEAKKKAS